MHQEQPCWHTIRGNKGKQDLLPKEKMMKHLLLCATDFTERASVLSLVGEQTEGWTGEFHAVRHGQRSPGRRQKLQEVISKAGGSTLTSQQGTERHQRAGDRQTQHQLLLRKEHPPLVWGQSITQPNATARTAVALSKPETLGTGCLMWSKGSGFHWQTNLWSVREAPHLDKNRLTHLAGSNPWKAG